MSKVTFIFVMLTLLVVSVPVFAAVGLLVKLIGSSRRNDTEMSLRIREIGRSALEQHVQLTGRRPRDLNTANFELRAGRMTRKPWGSS